MRPSPFVCEENSYTEETADDGSSNVIYCCTLFILFKPHLFLCVLVVKGGNVILLSIK